MSNSFAYNAPTALAGSYDEATNSVPLTWVAPTINDFTEFNVPGGYSWTPTIGFDSFVVTVIGAGGGGQSGGVLSAFQTTGGNGGAGGGIRTLTFARSDIGELPIDIEVGAGGLGGAGIHSGANAITGQNTGFNGTASAFGAFLTAGGGSANNPGMGQDGSGGMPGGTAAGGVSQQGAGTQSTTGSGLGANTGTDSNVPANAGASVTQAPGAGGGGGSALFRGGGPETAAAGGTGQSAASTPSPGGAINSTGTNSPDTYLGGFAGGGAGGGQYGTPATGLDGRDGGHYGGGGSGGGAGFDSANPMYQGKGGNGAGGVVAIKGFDLTLPLTGYSILRDGLPIGTSVAAAFTDLHPQSGDHLYTVVALSGSTVISPVSNAVEVDLNITLTAEAVGNAGSDVLLTWTVGNCADTQFSVHQIGITDPIAILPQNSIDGFVVMHLNPDTLYGFYIVGDVNGISNGVMVTTGCRAVEIFNCDCAIEPTQQTLAELRTRMMIRLGYPNQSANPPPGMALLVDAFLYDAQKLIWKQLSRAGLNVERFFRWIMVPGQRYYGIDQNADRCDLKLDPYKVTWAGFEDLNNAWYRLTEGVPPEFYTRANINFGWPTHYEIRSCIEIFPAPQAPYTLWIKGDFGLASFVEDADTATIDDEAVFLLALGNAKAHYGQKDAPQVLTQANTYILGLVAGLHGTRRYVPRTKVQNPATPPRFLPLGDAQA